MRISERPAGRAVVTLLVASASLATLACIALLSWGLVDAWALTFTALATCAFLGVGWAARRRRIDVEPAEVA